MRPSPRAYQVVRLLSLRIALLACALALAALPATAAHVEFTVDECGPDGSGAGHRVALDAGEYRIVYVSGAWRYYGAPDFGGYPPWLTAVRVYPGNGPSIQAGEGNTTGDSGGLWGIYLTEEDAVAGTRASQLRSVRFTMPATGIVKVLKIDGQCDDNGGPPLVYRIQTLDEPDEPPTPTPTPTPTPEPTPTPTPTPTPEPTPTPPPPPELPEVTGGSQPDPTIPDPVPKVPGTPVQPDGGTPTPTPKPPEPTPTGGGGGGSCPSSESKNPDNTVADPVHIVSGHLYIPEEDAAYSARGHRITLSRYYDSRRTKIGSFGKGWTNAYERYVRRAPDGVWVEVGGRGDEHVFHPDGSGGFLPAKGYEGRLTIDETGASVRMARGTVCRYEFFDGDTDYASLTSITNASGERIELRYVANSLTEIVEPSGRRLTFEYRSGSLSRGTPDYTDEGTGPVQAVILPNGDRHEFQYSDNKLTLHIDPVGRTTGYEYDGEQLTRIVRPDGTSVSYHYQDGRVSEVIEQTGGITALSYHPEANYTEITNPGGTKTFVHYDANHNVVRIVDPTGGEYRRTYDDDFRITSITNQVSQTWSYQYGPAGNVSAFSTPGGETTTMTIDPVLARPTAVTGSDGATVNYEFSPSGKLLATVLPSGRRTTYSYDATGLTTSVTTPDGATTKWTYDASGNPTRMVDPLGRVTRTKYDDIGRPIKITDSAGRVTKKKYFFGDLVSEETDAAGQVTAYTYCSCSAIESITRPSGAVTRFEYGTYGFERRQTSVTDPEGNVTRSQYDVRGKLIKTTDPRGNETTYQYDDAGRLVKVIDPLGGETTHTYDAAGRGLTTKDALQRETRFTYDTQGRLTRTDFPGGNFTQTTYNAAGLVSAVTDASGAATRYFYDEDRRRTRIQNPDGTTIATEFDTAGRQIKQTAADGGTYSTIYDSAGRVVAEVDPINSVRRTEYSTSGTVTRSIDARDHATSFEYDSLDRVVKSTNALGFSSRTSYGSDGETTVSVNARGKKTRYTYDRNLRLVQTTNAADATVKREYDAAGNATKITDERGQSWTLTWGPTGLKTSEVDPNGQRTEYRYNVAGEPTEIALPGNVHHVFVRDDAGRVIRREFYQDGTLEDTETTTYDIVGNALMRENGTQRITSSFDAMRREITRVVFFKRTGASREVRFSYDTMGRRQTRSDVTHGRSTLYAYDKASRVTKLTVLEPNPSATSVADSFIPREYNFTWDRNSNLETVEYPNGTRVRRVFDNIDRLTRLVHERGSGTSTVLLASWNIQRDENGNPTSIIREDGDTWELKHDALDRLVKAHLPKELLKRLRKVSTARRNRDRGRDDDSCLHEVDQDDDDDTLLRSNDNGVVTYTYDAAGNRTQETYGQKVVTSTFSPANELLTRGGVTFSYDARGNQIEKRYASGRRDLFDYSSMGRLVGFSTEHLNHNGGSIPLKEVQRYAYGPDGDRALVENVQTTTLTNFLWDGSRPVEEWRKTPNGNKDKGRLYTRGVGGDLLDEARYTRKNAHTAHSLEEEDCDDWDDLAAWRLGGSAFKLGHVRFAHPDLLGSTSLITNCQGLVLDRLSYGPYGEPLEGNFNRVRFGYTGHQFEARTGHWGSMYRYLDARAGRWTQRDPLGRQDGTNVYRYVRSGPVSAVDPLGLITFKGAFPAPWDEARFKRVESYLKQYFTKPANDLCQTFKGGCEKQCKVCPQVDYAKLLSDDSIVVIAEAQPTVPDPDRPGIVETTHLAQSFTSRRIEIYPRGFAKATEDLLMGDLIIHELTHIGTGSKEHGTENEAFRWVQYVFGNKIEADTGFSATGDPCP